MNGKSTEHLDISHLRKEMESILSSKRYTHTLGVAYTAAALAMAHGEDLEKAMTAGLLLNVTAVERGNPTALLHAKAGAYLAERKYGVSNMDILNAIRYHTTGRPDMSRLEKILYIADYIEPGRKQLAELEMIRRLAFQDLDWTMEKILANTLAYLRTTDNQVDDMTSRTYEYYKRQ